MVNIKQFLSHVYIFQSLSEEELSLLSSFCVLKEMKKGTLLFESGQEALSFYIIIHGKLKIYRVLSCGEEQVIHLHSDGDVVAEAAIFHKITYPGHCQILKDTLLIEIPKAPFLEMILTNPRLALNMLSSYSKRLRQLIGTIEYLSLKEGRERLALYILKNIRLEAGVSFCPLPHTKKETAALLGLTPESFSRSLTQLKNDQVIIENKEEKKLIIVEKQRLKDLVFFS